ncbi:MAG: hypothetical protein ACI9JL_003559 [Paracoccaceae bacterium]|jgi:hypothetical protein
MGSGCGDLSVYLLRLRHTPNRFTPDSVARVLAGGSGFRCHVTLSRKGTKSEHGAEKMSNFSIVIGEAPILGQERTQIGMIDQDRLPANSRLSRGARQGRSSHFRSRAGSYGTCHPGPNQFALARPICVRSDKG